MIRLHYILIAALLLSSFASHRNGGILTYLVGILIPFLVLIAILFRETHTRHNNYVEELEERKKMLLTVIHEVFRITESYIKGFTPFVESIHIKMIKCGVHSIHAAPVLGN